MKLLIAVDSSNAALAPIPHVRSLLHAGIPVEVLVLNVQPRFHRHIAQFTSRAARDGLRAARSAAAMERMVEALSRLGVRFRALVETGPPAERIAAVAEREQVDEIVMGIGRHPTWLRWINPSIAQGVIARTDIPVIVFASGRPGAVERFAVPAGLAALAALFIATE